MAKRAKRVATEERTHAEVKPGDRVVMSYGIVTVESVTPVPGDRFAYRWVEPQAGVLVNGSQTMTVVVG
jgi:hypothetical protein